MQENHQQPHISVVIPTRNEAQNLHSVLPYVPAEVGEVILVDGHSSNGTNDVAQRLYPSIQVIQQQRRDKGDALRVGIAVAQGSLLAFRRL